MGDIFGLDNLLAQLVLALGAALAVGNGFALVAHRMGKRPKEQQGDLRRRRAWFLLIVGLVMSYWGLGSIITR
jgi:hypothetical protein